MYGKGLKHPLDGWQDLGLDCATGGDQRHHQPPARQGQVNPPFGHARRHHQITLGPQGQPAPVEIGGDKANTLDPGPVGPRETIER